MQDLKMLETWGKQSKRPSVSGKRTLDDLPRLEARDIPDSGALPDGSRVRFGHRNHEIQPGRIMRRWFIECLACKRACKVLYRREPYGFVCRKCASLPYRTAISGRSERAVKRWRPDIPPDEWQAILDRSDANLRHDADASNARYHAKMRRRSCARDGYELPDVDSFTDGS